MSVIMPPGLALDVLLNINYSKVVAQNSTE